MRYSHGPDLLPPRRGANGRGTGGAPVMNRGPSLERSYLRAEQATAVWARSFYFASRFLPLDKKRAVFALYDYCRHADNLVDARGDRPRAQVLADLDALAATIRTLHA